MMRGNKEEVHDRDVVGGAKPATGQLPAKNKKANRTRRPLISPAAVTRAWELLGQQ